MQTFNFTRQYWRNVDSRLPWVSSFNKWLRLSNLPKLTGSTIYVASDYSGQHKRSPFEVLSLLVVDLDNSPDWEQHRRLVRHRFLRDGRRISFKALNDAQRRRALIPFLSAADLIHGICLVVAIQKGIKTLCMDEKILKQMDEDKLLQSKWRFTPFERMARITHFVSLMIAGLADSGHNVFWISDEDDMFMTLERCADVQRVLGVYSSLYIPFQLGELGIGTTRLDEGDGLEEDLAAVPDLAAGAVAQLLQRLHETSGGNISSQLATVVPEDLSKKTDILLSWLEDESGPLKRVKLMFKRGTGGFSLGPFHTQYSS